jgi:hypothetical protein
MSPTEKHLQKADRVEPLPDSIRDLLLAGKVSAAEALKTPRFKNGKLAPSVAKNGLSKKQKAVLCQTAKTAFETQRKHGLIDPGKTFEAWRHEQQLEAVQIASLTACKQAHYLPLLGHFNAIAGKTSVGIFKQLTSTADDPDRQSVAQALRTELARFAQLPDDQGNPTGEHRAEAYLFSIAQHRGNLNPRTVATIKDTWPTSKIWTLVYSLRNRIAAKTGVGKTESRNKSQRA